MTTLGLGSVSVALCKVIYFVYNIEQSLGANFFVGDLLGGFVSYAYQLMIVRSLDHHHGGTEFFFRTLFKMANQGC